MSRTRVFRRLIHSQSCSKCSDLGNELWLCLGQNNFCVSNCCCPGSIRLSFSELIKPDFLRSTLLRSKCSTLHKTGMSKNRATPRAKHQSTVFCDLHCNAFPSLAYAKCSRSQVDLWTRLLTALCCSNAANPFKREASCNSYPLFKMSSCNKDRLP